MFGGLSFLLHGHMCCGVVRDDIVIRVGPDAYQSSLNRPHTRPMDFTGKSLKGFVCVKPQGVAAESDSGEVGGPGSGFRAQPSSQVRV